MKDRRVLATTTALLALALLVPATVQAPTTIINPLSYHTKSYTFNVNDVISWNWHVVGNGALDFWIQDDQGNKYDLKLNETSDVGTFIVPSTGPYTLYWFNSDINGPQITLDYNVFPVSSANGQSILSGLLLMAIVIVIALVVVIIVVAVALMKIKAPKPPQYQQPPQHQQYQQGPPPPRSPPRR